MEEDELRAIVHARELLDKCQFELVRAAEADGLELLPAQCDTDEVLGNRGRAIVKLKCVFKRCRSSCAPCTHPGEDPRKSDFSDALDL